MNKIIKNIIVISFFSILLFSIRGCSQITYKTSKKTTSIEVQCEEISPNGKYKAISYIFTDGGATVSFRRGISIIDANEEKVEEFLKDNEPNIYLNNNSSKEVIDIKWEDNKTLKVKDRISYITENTKDVILVVEKDNEVIGYIHGSPYELLYNDSLINILGFVVKGDYRNTGVGNELINSLEDWAKENGYSGIRLVSGYERTDAHRFYEKHGYINKKDQRNFIKPIYK